MIDNARGFPHSFDSNSHLIPLYHKLAQVLRRQIITGEIREGEYIPTEIQLVEMFAVSRTTVRLAIAQLQNEGLLVRQQGKGTMVCKQKLQRAIPGLSSFTEEILSTGRHPGSTLDSIVVIESPEENVSRELQLRPGESVVRLTRKRFVDNEILGISESFFRKEFWEDLGVRPTDFENASLYQYLEERGHELISATETIEASACGRELARVLGISPGSPMMVLYRTVYGREDQPIEYASNQFRGDKYNVRLTHRRYKSGI